MLVHVTQSVGVISLLHALPCFCIITCSVPTAAITSACGPFLQTTAVYVFANEVWRLHTGEHTSPAIVKSHHISLWQAMHIQLTLQAVLHSRQACPRGCGSVHCCFALLTRICQLGPPAVDSAGLAAGDPALWGCCANCGHDSQLI